MKLLFSPLFLLLLSSTASFAQVESSPPPAVKSIQQSQDHAAPLTNQDLVELLQARMTPDEMIAKIKSSPANFDISEPALRALRDAGLPDAVIAAMMRLEKSGSISTVANSAPPPDRLELERQQPEQIVVPAGTQLDVEAAYTVDSLHVKAGDLISFRVLVPIMIDGRTVIEKGALVTARVDLAKRGGHWGHAGRLSWTMQDVVAVDGTRLPIRPEGPAGSDELGKPARSARSGKRNDNANTSNSVKGTSHSAEVITKAIIPGILFPPLAPLGLIHGFRRGENAVLPEGKRFLAFMSSNANVTVESKR
ncbi:MAG: hypothetical protein JWM21_987 [Acidobacteria bacterium]|nr:hypothetical protein [Acidobacteriota bacterium]